MTTTIVTSTLTCPHEIAPTHSRIDSVSRHAMATKVRGTFNELEGSASAPTLPDPR